MTANTLDELIKFNRNKYKTKDYPLLSSLKGHWLRDKPLSGLNILHNIPLTFETAVKLESLVAAGANLTVTHTVFAGFPAKQEVVDLLTSLGIKYVANQSALEGDFDIALDCCAEMFSLPKVNISKGLVELTQSGGNKLKSCELNIPVINIDDSHLKNLECMYGTGEAFLRALKIMIKEPLTNKRFTLFGFGKVGKGVAKYLTSLTSQITVIENKQQALNEAKALSFNAIDANNTALVKEELRNAFCIITATGIHKLLSSQFNADELRHAYIANMGADDEIGDLNLPKTLFEGSAINFSLENPTLMHFIDPIFYAHNVAAQILIEQKMEAGYHRLPKYLDTLIIDSFNTYHDLEIDNIY